MFFGFCCLSVVVVQGCSGTPSALFWTPLSPTSAACPPLSLLQTAYQLSTPFLCPLGRFLLRFVVDFLLPDLFGFTFNNLQNSDKTNQTRLIRTNLYLYKKKLDFCMPQTFWYIDFFFCNAWGWFSIIIFLYSFYPPKNLFQNSPFVIPWSSSLERWERKCHLKDDPLVAFIRLKTELKPQ